MNKYVMLYSITKSKKMQHAYNDCCNISNLYLAHPLSPLKTLISVQYINAHLFNSSLKMLNTLRHIINKRHQCAAYKLYLLSFRVYQNSSSSRSSSSSSSSKPRMSSSSISSKSSIGSSSSSRSSSSSSSSCESDTSPSSAFKVSSSSI